VHSHRAEVAAEAGVAVSSPAKCGADIAGPGPASGGKTVDLVLDCKKIDGKQAALRATVSG